MFAYLPELLALPLLPLLKRQGSRTRAATERLPVPEGDAYGRVLFDASDATPLHVLAIGESPVAGVGVSRQDDTITAQFANKLARDMQRAVNWRAYGVNGATVREAERVVLPQLQQSSADVVLIGFGVNDTTAFRRPSAWRADLLRLLDAVQSQRETRLICLCGVPPMGRFPALPQPLKFILGLKSSVLDQELAAIAATRLHTIHVPMSVDLHEPGLMASDGYHPSAAGCTVWANQLATACSKALLSQNGT